MFRCRSCVRPGARRVQLCATITKLGRRRDLCQILRMMESLFPIRIALLAAGLSLCACQSQQSAAPVVSTPPPRVPSPTSGSAQPLPPDSAPAIARREVIRRQERIRQMDEAAIRASQAMAEDDLEGAVSGFRRAVGGLP